MKTMQTRLDRLEQDLGIAVPLWIQRWLGASLSDADRACAAAEWEARQRAPQRDPATFPPALRDWLQERNSA